MKHSEFYIGKARTIILFQFLVRDKPLYVPPLKSDLAEFGENIQ